MGTRIKKLDKEMTNVIGDAFRQLYIEKDSVYSQQEKTEKANEKLKEYIDHNNFIIAREKIVGRMHNDKGIGTLSEKAVHGVLKNYFEPDEDNHEVALEGYYADIYNSQGIIEIQTRNMDKLRGKLAVFLNYYPVTVVYPMPLNAWISWVDSNTGEIITRRKSPVHFNMYDAFYELYKIKDYLKNSNIRVKLVLMDMEEYKILIGSNNTKKKRALKYDRIPIGIKQIITLEQPEDYMQFIPFELENEFTSQDFSKVCGISKETASMALNILFYMGTVKRIGKKGRMYLYRIEE